MGNVQTFVTNNAVDDLPCFEPITIEGMSVTVNGRVIQGRTMSMNNGVLYVDGVRQNPNPPKAGADGIVPVTHLSIVIEGSVQGNIASTSGDVTVKGSAHKVSNVNGGIQIGGDVSGDASTVNGGIMCNGDIKGAASTVNGSVRTSQDANERTAKKRRHDTRL